MRYLNQLKIIILCNNNNYEIADDMMKQREGNLFYSTSGF
jgi:hypothetical protein